MILLPIILMVMVVMLVAKDMEVVEVLGEVPEGLLLSMDTQAAEEVV